MHEENSRPNPIEVYEWEDGEPRPHPSMNDRRPVVSLGHPPSGAPAIGDTLIVGEQEGNNFTFYKVMERVHLWTSADDPYKEHTWLKVMLLVRRLDDEPRSACTMA